MEKEWYVLIDDDRQRGPFTWNELQVLAKEGDLLPQDKVRSEEKDDWMPCSYIEGLFPEAVLDSEGAEPEPPQPEAPLNEIWQETAGAPGDGRLMEKVRAEGEEAAGERVEVPEEPEHEGTVAVGEPEMPEHPSINGDAAPAAVYGPLSVWQYFFILLVALIPVVNLVFLLKWSFGRSTGPARKNVSRALLLWLLLIAAVCGGVYLAWYIGSL